MGLLTKITDFVTGGLFGEIKDVVTSYFPPDMTPEQKAEASLKVERFLHEKELAANRILTDAASALDSRIREQEGTASDLKSIPIIGTLIIFLRGVQRPLWGYATLVMDFKWFFEPSHSFNEQQQTALIVINMLVLGFLFGERTIKNLEPLILKVFGGK